MTPYAGQAAGKNEKSERHSVRCCTIRAIGLAGCVVVAALPPGLLIKSAFRPKAAFAELAEAQPDPHAVFFRQTLWLALLPPVFVFIGTANFGWRLGAAAPLRLGADALVLVGIGYFLTLWGALVGTAVVARWMAVTYGARQHFGVHLALVGQVAAPLALASLCHLFPHVFLNLLVLIPALLWSLYLLYTGLPVALRTGPERGMLMASSLVAWLLVGAVSLLGLTVALWTGGIGPSLGV